MDRQSILFVLGMLFFYLLPFVILYFFQKPINQFLAKSHTRIRFVDLLPIYFILGIHIFTHEIFSWSFLPYYIIFLCLLGMLLASIFYWKNKSLPFNRFIRMWWRIQDLLSMALFFVFGIVFFITYFS